MNDDLDANIFSSGPSIHDISRSFIDSNYGSRSRQSTLNQQQNPLKILNTSFSYKQGPQFHPITLNSRKRGDNPYDSIHELSIREIDMQSPSLEFVTQQQSETLFPFNDTIDHPTSSIMQHSNLQPIKANFFCPQSNQTSFRNIRSSLQTENNYAEETQVGIHKSSASLINIEVLNSISQSMQQRSKSQEKSQFGRIKI